MNTTDPQVPRTNKSERYLLTCVVGFPERAAGIVELAEPKHLFDELHQKLWRLFRTQSLNGGIDVNAAGREFDCAAYLLELGYDATTTVHAEAAAKDVREKAKLRALQEVALKTAAACGRGRDSDSIIASLKMALEGFELGVTA